MRAASRCRSSMPSSRYSTGGWLRSRRSSSCCVATRAPKGSRACCEQALAARVVAVLPPRFENADGYGVAEIEAALAGSHRQADMLRSRDRLANRCRQACGLRAEDEPVTGPPGDIGEARRAARRECEQAARVRSQ